ncbi:glycogen synthase GlgA [Novosphingobium sp. RD2P27]|uniref:Glycogen synthase n=1 Tax=Novosphingobium kalidii TaxID=3230299 RepID=A0ABV2CXV4_9SPHN
MPLRVLSVASEAVPFVKTGGLADVAGALPAALAPHGIEVTTLLPGYRSVLAQLPQRRVVHAWDSLLGEPARLLAGMLGDAPLVVLDAPGLFDREGGPYVDAYGIDWNDNWRRFAALSRAAADVAGGAMVVRGKARKFDLLHAHDWQAGLAPAYLRWGMPEGSQVIPSVMTIHNMAFQGWQGAEIFPGLWLPPEAWSIDGVEYHGGVSLLKAGLVAASAITTVSPTYAQEIRTPEYGMGLQGVIAARGRAVTGILNGIDSGVWNPEVDEHLPKTFAARTLTARVANKRSLEAEFELEPGPSPRAGGPIFVVISRLTWQKGMDVLLDTVDELVRLGGRLALLGSGDPDLEAGFHAAAARHSGRVSVRIGYNEDLSHRMQGGGDVILVPSRFEPCGLTQLYGLAYGCVPVVSRTGGLADTVIDANPAALMAGVATGIQHGAVSVEGLSTALMRAIALYDQPNEWARLQRNGMACDFSWQASGKAYAELYRSLVQ